MEKTTDQFSIPDSPDRFGLKFLPDTWPIKENRILCGLNVRNINMKKASSIAIAMLVLLSEAFAGSDTKTADKLSFGKSFLREQRKKEGLRP